MNTLHLQDIVKGKYGRKIAYTDVETITQDNVVKVVGNCIGVFNWNKHIIKYLGLLQRRSADTLSCEKSS